MSYLKFCFHEGAGGRGYPKENLLQLNQAGIPFGAKATDKMPFDAQEIARQFPHIPNTVIFRRSVRPAGATDPPSGNPDVPQYDLPPLAAAVAHWAWHKANFPPELDKSICWVETVNEIAQQFTFEADEEDKARQIPLYGLRSIYQRADGRWVVTNGEWMARFALETAVCALADGYRWAAFGWGPGEPETAVWHGDRMVEFLSMCANFPDRLAIALHEYSLDAANIWNGNGWHVGRFLKLYGACEDNQIPYPTTMITEWGWTLNDLPAWEEAQSDYLEVGKLYALYPTIRTAATWALNDGWGGIADKAAQHIQPLLELTMSITFPDEEEPPVPPAVPCEWYLDVGRKAHLIPQDTSLEELQQVTREFHPARNSFVYSHDDAGLIASHGNPERSLVYVWNPERWAGTDILAWYADRGIRTETRYFMGQPPVVPDVINVAPLSQRDPLWAAHLCGYGPKTIGQWGCLLVVYTMLARYWGISDGRFPDAENEWYKVWGGFAGDNLVSMAMSKVYAPVVDEGWLTNGAAMHARTQAYLADGIPVPARVDFNPTTGDAREQHWVLLVGYDPARDDYLMNDPWTGKAAVYVSDYYGIPGSDVLECIYYKKTAVPPPSGALIDQTQYYAPQGGEYGPICIVGTSWDGDIRQQVQRHGSELAVTKGTNIEIRQVDMAAGVIRFVLDDSPGDNKYYTIQSPDGWIPLLARVGDRFVRRETATFYWKSNCLRTPDPPQTTTNEMHFAAYHETWTSPLNPQLVYHGVSEWHWVLNGVVEEKYFLSPHRAYAGWWNRHGRSAYIKEDIPVGQQGNNVFHGACYHAPFGVEYP